MVRRLPETNVKVKGLENRNKTHGVYSFIVFTEEHGSTLAAWLVTRAPENEP